VREVLTPAVKLEASARSTPSPTWDRLRVDFFAMSTGRCLAARLSPDQWPSGPITPDLHPIYTRFIPDLHRGSFASREPTRERWAVA
jgi:hypothetical protein